MSIVAALRGRGPSGFGYGSTAEEVVQGLDLSGRTILVTGTNSGLGFETIRALAGRGAKVLATARTEEKARSACAALNGGSAAAVPLACELSDPTSIRACIAKIKAEGFRPDAIICNAGIMALPELRQAFGYELQFFTNHVGHFILVTGLLEQLSDRARLVIVSSSAHIFAPREGVDFSNLSGERGYSPWVAYGRSKLANILFVKELARRFAGSGHTANAVHPGVINTNLMRSMSPVMRMGAKIIAPLAFKNAAQGAATQCYVATNPRVEGVSGEYFSNCNIARSSKISRDPALAARLWRETERIVSTLP
ncbi:MAG: SDR family oxidoreductase [Deltaproteobacteria bacterium]|nr:SDR family oxidoreductase [Deltaproteobacteria bacterium]